MNDQERRALHLIAECEPSEHALEYCKKIARAALASRQEVPQGFIAENGDTLWLWKNGDHYLAFKHLYPCFEPAGDPMTLGQPFGRAEFRASHDRVAASPPQPAPAAREPLTHEKELADWYAVARETPLTGKVAPSSAAFIALYERAHDINKE